MKQILILLSIFLLALTACGTSETAGIPNTEVTTTVPGTTATGTNEEQVIEQVKADTESKNDKSTPLVVPIIIKKGVVGDSVIFGAVFNLVNRQPGAYFARISFIEGRDKNNNRIEADKDTMKTWLRSSETEVYNILKDGNQFVPLIFRIRDEIKPGVKTLPGNYQFEVQFFIKEDASFSDELDGVVKSVYVKVE